MRSLGGIGYPADGIGCEFIVINSDGFEGYLRDTQTRIVRIQHDISDVTKSEAENGPT